MAELKAGQKLITANFNIPKAGNVYNNDSEKKKKPESRSEDVSNRGPRGIKYENFIPSKTSNNSEVPRVLGQFGTLPANLDLSGTGSSTNPQRLESNELVNNYLFSNQKSSLRAKKKPRPPSFDYKRRGENSSSNDDDIPDTNQSRARQRSRKRIRNNNLYDASETDKTLAKNNFGFFKTRTKKNINSLTAKNLNKSGAKTDPGKSNSRNMFSIRKPVIIKKQANMPTNFSNIGNYKNRTFTSDIMHGRTVAP